jgi:hypothetical protein
MYKFHKDGTLPMNNEIFVFGSNLAGRHGAGAAKIAVQKFGAVYGTGIGLSGLSYAIPTKDQNIRRLPLSEIKLYIDEFIRLSNHPILIGNFFVTRVGCGLAGYTDSEIAPLFKGAKNCSFAEEWEKYL